MASTKIVWLRLVKYIIGTAIICGSALVLMIVATPVPVTAPVPIEQPVSTSSHLITTSVRSVPVRVEIPSIGLVASFTEPLGLTATQEIEVPTVFDAVGWYERGPSPGEIGGAVILGHVDSYQGPAVFWSLGSLVPDDTIIITRADGTKLQFVVEESKQYAQANFPTLAVYGPVDYPALRLITCSGTYDRGTKRYTHNLVVYARLEKILQE